MPALQRSCDGCVKAKRHCNLAAPRCGRCSGKNITCTYVNQPSATTSSQKMMCNEIIRKYSSLDKTGSSKLPLPDGFIPGTQTWIPEIIRVFSPVTLQQQKSILRSFVVQFVQHGTSPFLHAHLYELGLPEPLHHALRFCTNHGLTGESAANPKHENVRLQVNHMLHSAAKSSSFSELLANVQAIAFLEIICLFEARTGSEEETALNDGVFFELVQLLYMQVPEQLPDILSPWRAWLFAESIRRTMLVCHIILAVHGVLRRGYATYLLCVEALPFDMRSHLWDAGTADAWEVAVAAASQEPSLVSPRQFTTLWRQTREPSPFESLLLLSFK